MRIRNVYVPRLTYFLQDENKEKANKLLHQVDSLKVLNIVINFSIQLLHCILVYTFFMDAYMYMTHQTSVNKQEMDLKVLPYIMF